MRNRSYLIIYVLLLFSQVMLNNFLNFSYLVTISVLPALVMCFSTKRSTLSALLLSFIMAFAVDFISDGQLGLSIMALLPVALLRRHITGLVLGWEIFLRDEELSLPRQGMLKILLLLSMGIGLYLAVYILVDSAGTYSFGFCVLKWTVSLALSLVISIPVAVLLIGDSRWR